MKTLIRSMIRAAIPTPDAGSFGSQARADDSQRCQAMLEVARERLREAHSARDRAAGQLRTAEETLRKALGVIDDSSAADRASDEAEATARAASRAWATRGCQECEQPDEELLGAAAKAHAAAVDARVLADGAREAIPGLESAVESARYGLESAKSEILEAARAALLAKAETHFAVMDRAAGDFDEASREVQSLARALSGRIHPFGSAAAAGTLLARIRGALPVPPLHDTKDLMLHGAVLDSDAWVALARGLIDDPEAKL